MPNETLEISKFFGTVSKVDDKDLPEEISTYSKNVDPESPMGQLRAITGLTDLLSGISDGVKMSAFIEKDKDFYTLIYSDDISIKARENFYSFGNQTSVDGSGIIATSMLGHNKEVRIGTGNSSIPKWCGYVKDTSSMGKIHFDGIGTNNLIIDQNTYVGTGVFTFRICKIEFALQTGISYGTSNVSANNLITILVNMDHGLIEEQVGTNINVAWAKEGSPLSFGTAIYSISRIVSSTSFEMSLVSGGAINYAGVYHLEINMPSMNTSKPYIQWSLNGIKQETNILLTSPYTTSAGVKISFADVVNYPHRVGDKWTINYSLSSFSLLLTDQELKNFKNNIITDPIYITMAVTNGLTGTSTDFIFNGKKYYYAYSLTYDNYQDSPLAQKCDISYLATVYSKRNNVNLTINYTGSLGRLTGIKIWRAEGELGGYNPDTKFRLIQDTPFDSWTAITGGKSLTVYDEGQAEAMYETYTEMPEEILSSMVNYTLSTMINDKLVVTNCTTSYFDDATKMLFFSKAGKPDTFDPSHDFVKLGFVPKAIIGFQGKLYAFGNNNIAKINPEALFIEDTTTGYGIYDSQSIMATEWGIYWADINGAYYFDGRNPTKCISEDIHGKTESDEVEWATLFSGDISLRIVYSPVKKSVIFINCSTGLAWCYYLPDSMWYYWDMGTACYPYNVHAFEGKDGEIYLINKAPAEDNNIIYNWSTLFNKVTYLPLEWRSKEFKFNDGNQPKNFYTICMDGNCDLYYRAGNNTSFILMTDENVSIGDRRNSKVQFKVVGDRGTTKKYIDSVSIKYRRLNVQ